MANILYVAEFPDERLSDVTQFSPAGRNKKIGYIDAMQSVGHSVALLSPVFVPDTGRSLVGPFSSTRSDVAIHYPYTLCLHPIPNLIVTILAAVFTLRRFRDEQIDAVVFWNFELQYCLPALIAAVVFDAKLIVEYEDGFFNHPNSYLRLSEKFCKRIAPIDGAVLTTSKLEPHVPTENTAIIRGVSTVFQFPDRPEPESDGPVQILFSGGLREGKGVDCFIQMVEQWPSRNDTVQFLICGHSNEERKEELREKIRSLNDMTIEFLGTVEPWEDYLELVAGADILLVLEDPRDPFNQYCFPSKLIEYAKSGNIVITSNISDVKTLDPLPFKVVETYDPAVFASAVETVIDDLEEEQQTASTLTHRWIETECRPDVVGKKINRVIRRA